MAKKKTEYNASNIQALSQHNHLLKRLSLTFGRETGDEESPFSSQKSVAIREIVDNAVDEVMGGYNDRIRVTYHKDGAFEVQDGGRGLPIDAGMDSNGNAASGIYLCLGVIQSGGKFGTDSKRFSGGLNGVGASSSTHTSKRTDVTVFRDKKKYTLSFKDGDPGFFDEPENPDANFTPLTDLTYVKEEKDDRSKEEKEKFPKGTIVKLWLRDSVYSSPYPVDTLDLTERLKGISYLMPEVTIEVVDEINLVEDPETGEKSTRYDNFNFTGGLSELVETNLKATQLTDVLSFQTQATYIEKGAAVFEDGKVTSKDVERIIEADVSFAWENDYDYEVESYVNTIRTRLGGVHEVAFERALVAAFSERFASMQGMMKKSDPKLTFDDFQEGLVSVLSIRLSEPQFTGQAKEELGGKDVQKIMIKQLTEEFSAFANNQKNNDVMRKIGEKVLTAARNRQAIRDQQALNRKKNAIENSGSLPDKLTDCGAVGHENSELYVIEGDSAKGSLKGARFGEYQALLAIKGKIICATANPMSKVMANKEVQDIIQALGAGSGDSFDLEKCRYGRVFIATDADPDGGDIAALIISLFWELFRPLIEAGRLYKVNTPLFVVYENENTKTKVIRHYANTEDELAEITADLKERKKKHRVQRLKGLGEGGDEVMEETAMDPSTRTVERVKLKDVKRAQEMLNIVFGEDTEIRKEWISSNPIDEFSVIG